MFDEETRRQAEKLATDQTQREQLLSVLPKPMGAMYNRISKRIRDGIAVAEVRKGDCMACFMSLRTQAMAKVRRGPEVITCDNCNRILYYAGESAPASSTPAQPKMAHT